MRATAKLDARVREPNRRLSVEQNQCVPATGNFPRVPPLALLLPSWHAILFHLCSCRDQPSSLAYPSLAAFPSLFLSLSFLFLPLVRSLLRISGYTNTVGHAHPRFNPIRSRSHSRYGSSSLSHFPLLLSPSRSPSPLPSEDVANSPGANKLYYFYRGFHLERT